MSDTYEPGYHAIDDTPVKSQAELAGEAPREPTIRELAEIDAVTLPPHQRPAAIERMVAERTSASVQRAIADAMLQTEDTAWRPQVRVEVPPSLRARDANVYLDGVKLASVAAVRLQHRGEGFDTYVVLRVSDADVQWPSSMDRGFGRFDMSMRDVKGFVPGVNIAPRGSEGPRR